MLHTVQFLHTLNSTLIQLIYVIINISKNMLITDLTLKYRHFDYQFIFITEGEKQKALVISRRLTWAAESSPDTV